MGKPQKSWTLLVPKALGWKSTEMMQAYREVQRMHQHSPKNLTFGGQWHVAPTGQHTLDHPVILTDLKKKTWTNLSPTSGHWTRNGKLPLKVTWRVVISLDETAVWIITYNIPSVTDVHSMRIWLVIWIWPKLCPQRPHTHIRAKWIISRPMKKNRIQFFDNRLVWAAYHMIRKTPISCLFDSDTTWIIPNTSDGYPWPG